MTRFAIRAFDLGRSEELDWAARGMRATLIEVEGEAVGGAMYTLDWLCERARWHAEACEQLSGLLLALDAAQIIVGHTRLREEPDGEGLISTTYVLPAARRQGVAQAWLFAGEAWLRALDLRSASTWTSATNSPLIHLYESHDYQIVERQTHAGTGTPMLRLSRAL